MGNSRSSEQLQPEDLNNVEQETGFTPQQIEKLYSRYSRDYRRPASCPEDRKTLQQVQHRL